MKRSAKFPMSLKPVAFAALTILLVLGVGAAFPGSGEPSARKDLSGQTATLLPDGSWLLLGGEGGNGPVAAGFLWNEATGGLTQLPTRMKHSRAFHTATVLADGKVAVIGGQGSNGSVVPVEIFKPDVQSFDTVSIQGDRARSHHTATLLTDGQVLIVGGRSSAGKTLDDAQLWNPRTNKIVSLSSRLARPRSGHTAVLTSDGNVLIQGGVDRNGQKLNSSELFNATSRTFTPISKDRSKADVSQSASQSSSALAGSIPVDGATNVSTSTIISLRFSEPMQVESVNTETVTLDGPNGGLAVAVVPAEGGMLAFVNPDSELAPSTKYTVTVDGAVAHDGSDLAKTSFHFTTGATGGTSGGGGASGPGSSGNDSGSTATVWTPTSDWRTHLPPSPWQSLAPLMAPGGVTALSGQVLTIDGNPLANVTLQVGPHKALSDGTGRFLIQGIQAGQVDLMIDATTANSNGRVFGIYQVGVAISAHVTNVLPFTSWMPVLDMAHAVTVPSPTIKETVISNPLMPGLELHIPAGTTILDINGKVVQTVSMTPVPLDRPPFPLPAGVDVPIYFTIQPGLAQLQTPRGGWSWAWLVYPNLNNWPVGSPFNFWNYEADNSGWYVYGKGKVASGGQQIVPDPGVGFYEFSGAMAGNSPAPSPRGKCPGGADPVDCSTGLFFHSETDLHISDVIPIDFQRTYLSQDSQSRPFGIGTTDNYEIFMTANNNTLYTKLDLILSDGEQVNYINTNSNTSDYPHSLFVPTLSSDAAYYGSTMTWNGNGWNLTRKDGTVYAFPDSFGQNNPAKAALISITDRLGNKLTISRDSNGNITQITSPNGRWMQFQHDASNRITQATDGIGRTVTYTYDSYTATGRPTCSSTGMLCAVTDAKGGVTSYSYDGGDRMLTVSDPRGNTAVTNTFDPTTGRVTNQLLADGTSNFQFAYTVNGNGQITQTNITDPNNNVEVKVFDGNGYITGDTRANGVSGVQQTFSYTRDPNSELITEMTDPLNRQVSYGYDTFQLTNYLGTLMTLTHANLLSVTCSNCLSQSINYSMTYDPVFNQVTSVTDPLSHSWSMGYDGRGNMTTVTDPLQHALTLGYNFQGQLTSVSDALSDTAQFTYMYGDLATIMDPAGAISSRFSDGAGRLLFKTDALGNGTGYVYDNLDQVTQITDPNNGLTKFSYDGNSNLLTVKDAKNNQTSYTYDARNRELTRKDALLKSDTYVYDGNSNVTKHTDRLAKVTTYQYDALNRPISIAFVGDTITPTWDAGNRVTMAVDSTAGTINRTWDGLNRLTQEVTPQGTINYTYDNASRRATMQVVGQAQAIYTFDNANRLTAITQGSQSVGLNYDNANRRTCLTLPNGVVASYGYDNDSRVTALTYGTGGNCSSPPSNLGNLTYSYDTDGRRVATAGSLAAVTLPANLTGGTSTVYNADNAQTKFSGISHVFNAAGNMTSDGTNTYTFDARHHLSAISGGATASFVYDAFGRRTKKVVAGTTTQFLYDGFNPVQELNSSNQATANLLTGLRVDEFLTRTDSSNNVSTLITDALGSTIGLVGSAQTIATSYTYQPFGATTVSGAVNGSSYEFTGRENDGTGLYYYRARYYSPSFQRFTAQNPIGFRGGDANLYAYVANNPVSFVSPFGIFDSPTTTPSPTPTPGASGPPSWLWDLLDAYKKGTSDNPFDSLPEPSGNPWEPTPSPTPEPWPTPMSCHGNPLE